MQLISIKMISGNLVKKQSAVVLNTDATDGHKKKAYIWKY